MSDGTQFLAAGTSRPAEKLELVGVTYAARCLGVSPEGLRHRIRNNLGRLRPVGMTSDPERFLFRKQDVTEAVEEMRRYDENR